MSNEVFVPIAGFEGLYEISNMGRIYSVPRKTKGGVPYGGYFLKPTSDLYPSVFLSNGTAKKYSIHVLVCKAFHGPRPSDRHLAAHWDGDPKNNRADNIRWATARENNADQIRHGTDLLGEKAPAAKLTNAQAVEIRKIREEQKLTYKQIASLYGVAMPTIADIITRKHFRHV